jgi:hypothetical protein
MITAMIDCLPRMLELGQAYPRSPRLELTGYLKEEFAKAGVSSKITPGVRIAVGVGSRGITNLSEIVKAVLGILEDAGAKPFLLPAMGSHGGATPDGQQKVLAEYGITPAAMGVPFETSMEVEEIGMTPWGDPVVFSAPALKADGVVVINRIKPHTDFYGDLGSGLQKMLAIGFGKHVGAINTHATASRVGHEVAIRETAKVILGRVPVLCGVAILEDQHHKTAKARVIEAPDIPAQEAQLLVEARSLMPRLPFDEMDLLIVDQLGKEISGTGMDTNVIGRGVFGYISSLQSVSALKPHISRIFVRDLSAATNGNGIGIGLADFTTTRAVKALNLNYVYTNALTSLGLPCAKIPMYFDTDREVIAKAIDSLAAASPEKVRIVRITDTLNLDRLLISEPLAELARGRADLEVVGAAKEIEFDGAGNLLPF